MPTPQRAPVPNDDEERIRLDEESVKALQNAEQVLRVYKKEKAAIRAINPDAVANILATEEQLDQEEGGPAGIEMPKTLGVKSKAQPKKPGAKQEEQKKKDEQKQGPQQDLEKAKADEKKQTEGQQKPKEPKKPEEKPEQPEEEKQQELAGQQQKSRRQQFEDMKERYQRMQKARKARAGERGASKAGKQVGKEATKGVERKAGAEAGKQAGKQVAKQGIKQGLRAAATEAGEGLLALAAEVIGPILLFILILILFVVLVVVIMRGLCGTGFSSWLDSSALCSGVPGLGVGGTLTAGGPGGATPGKGECIKQNYQGAECTFGCNLDTVAKCPPQYPAAYDAYIAEASALYKIDESFIKAIISQESRWSPTAHNPDSNASGLMQVIPGTWNEECGEYGPHDNAIRVPRFAILCGTKYLSIVRKELINRYDDKIGNDIYYIAAAYNAGPSPTRDSKGRPPGPFGRSPSPACAGKFQWECPYNPSGTACRNDGWDETRNYVITVRRLYNEYANGKCVRSTSLNSNSSTIP